MGVYDTVNIRIHGQVKPEGKGKEIEKMIRQLASSWSLEVSGGYECCGNEEDIDVS